MISLKCPNCNGYLTTDENREFLFCEYCGHKILLGDKKDYNFTYHVINEADIRQAEAHEKIELEKIRSNERVKIKKLKSQNSNEVVAGIIAIVLFLTMAAVLIPQFLHYYSKSNAEEQAMAQAIANYEQSLTGETITVIFSSSDLTGENYSAAITELKNAGFTDITTIPMKDLGITDLDYNGWVSDVSIDGIKKFSSGNKFAKDAKVILKYHSFNLF